MKVYVLIDNGDDCCNLEGVFSKRIDAQNYAHELDLDEYIISETELIV